MSKKTIYETHVYLIIPMTNLHVGSGDTSYGIIDKLVQRDSVTRFPVIHSSSLKGGLREYFENGNTELSETQIERIFGSKPKLAVGKEPQNGEYRFFSGELLFLPVRSNLKPYYQATCNEILNAFLNKISLFPALNMNSSLFTQIKSMQDFPLNGSPIVFNQPENPVLEDWEAKNIQIDGFNLDTIPMDGPPALMPYQNVRELTENLPVIARNYLEDGVSDNLWYEEIVPHHTIFYTMVAIPKTFDDNNEMPDPDFETFNKILTGENNLIQLGGNASIGYGFCQFIKQ
ncbi:MAG: type III-B CRISPR module RAMP protein Cmr4 [Saprospiraceae bacterium]